MLIELSNSGGRIVEAEAQAGAQFDQNRSTSAGELRVADRREVVLGDRACVCRVEPGQAPPGDQRRHRLVGRRVRAVGHRERHRRGDPGLGEQGPGAGGVAAGAGADRVGLVRGRAASLGMSDSAGSAAVRAPDGGDVGVAVGRGRQGQAHLLVGEHLAARVGHEVVDHAGARVDRALLEAGDGGDLLLDGRRGASRARPTPGRCRRRPSAAGRRPGCRGPPGRRSGRGGRGAPGRWPGSSSGCAPRCRPCRRTRRP